MKFEKYHHSSLGTRIGRISTPHLMGTGMWFVGGMPRTHGPLLAILQLNDVPKGRSCDALRCSKICLICSLHHLPMSLLASIHPNALASILLGEPQLPCIQSRKSGKVGKFVFREKKKKVIRSDTHHHLIAGWQIRPVSAWLRSR